MPGKGKGKTSGIQFTFELDRSGQAVVGMLKRDFKERLEKIKQQTVYKSAEYVQERVVSIIPSTDEYDLYRRSLEIARITGLTNGDAGYAVRVPTRNKKIKGIDSQRSLIYIKPRKTLSRIRPAIKVLADGSPWTTDTLPFWPAKKEAKVIVRKVSSQEVKKISKKLRRTAKRTWKRALSRAGVRTSNKAKPLKIPKTAKIVPDLAFSAIRLEFGQGGVRAKPHWRPAIRSLVSERLPRMGNDADFKQALLAPTSRTWKKWPTRTKSSISTRMAEGYEPFQKRLRVKI